MALKCLTILQRVTEGKQHMHEVRTRCQVVSVEGDDHLERVQCLNGATGMESVESIRHLFVMTGAVSGDEVAGGLPRTR